MGELEVMRKISPFVLPNFYAVPITGWKMFSYFLIISSVCSFISFMLGRLIYNKFIKYFGGHLLGNWKMMSTRQPLCRPDLEYNEPTMPVYIINCTYLMRRAGEAVSKCAGSLVSQITPCKPSLGIDVHWGRIFVNRNSVSCREDFPRICGKTSDWAVFN